MQFPKHKASLILHHNDHLSYYKTVQQAVDDKDHGYSDDWVSEEQKQKAIKTNECWLLQWYPETPIGFCLLAACDLSVLLEAACKEE
jgi:hypothetical protein